MQHRVEPISGDITQIDRAVLQPVELVELAWLGLGLGLGLGIRLGLGLGLGLGIGLGLVDHGQHLRR